MYHIYIKLLCMSAECHAQKCQYIYIYIYIYTTFI